MDEDEFERIRDEVAEKVERALRRYKVENRLLDPSIFTRRDLGIQAVGEVYNGYDHGATGREIQREINRVASSSRLAETWKEHAASRFLENVLSRGYYGYVKLRKQLGFPVESPTFRWWNMRYFDRVLSLINPGGLVFVKEGTYDIGTASPTEPNTIMKSNITLAGVGYATHLRATYDGLGELIRVGDQSGIPNNTENVIIRDLRITCAAGVTNVNAIGCGLYTSYIRNILVENVYAEVDHDLFTIQSDAPGHPVINKNITVRHCHAVNCRYGIATNMLDMTLNHFWVLDNLIESPTSNGISHYGDATSTCGDFKIIGNTVKDATGVGIRVPMAYGCPSWGHISHNLIDTVGERGIDLTRLSPVVVSGNIIRNPTTEGIYVHHCVNTALMANTIEGVGGAASYIFINAGTYITIAGNILHNEAGHYWLETTGNPYLVATGNFVVYPSASFEARSSVFGNPVYRTEHSVLSGTFAIDSTGLKTVGPIAHDCDYTPSPQDVQATISEDTDVDDWWGYVVKVYDIDATNLYVQVYVADESATGGATAKVAVRITKYHAF